MADKRKYKRSKEEIAREFDLPERKSKIATIMKQDYVGYCICRSSDCSRFMIGCDGCEEWYHGDCINITEKEAKHIKHYYCLRCKEDDPSLQTVFRVLPVDKTSTPNGLGNYKERRKKKHHTPANTKAQKQRNRCGSCDGCRAANCNNCEPCRVRVGHKPRCVRRVCVVQQEQQLQDQRTQKHRNQKDHPPTERQQQKQQDSKMQQQPSRRQQHHMQNFAPLVPQSSQIVRHKKKDKPPKERSRKRKVSLSPEMFVNPELEGLRQCYGPGCGYNARSQSKYCSDNCGINMASTRIFQVLPQRIQEWNLSRCRAEEENRKQLDQIRSKQAVVRFALAELDKRHDELQMIVERAKHTSVEHSRAQETGDLEDEQSMYCITCGHEIHSRTAIKHMEKCFNKYESQASFGSIFKTRIEGTSMFCDYYNMASQTYCKRLRVLCPEHCKDPKINDNDVCGCPLVTDVFNLTGEFCRAPKKSCFRHYVWEKIRRAEIDLERVRQWMKMDELLEQERQIRQLMASRAGVLGLLLHSTYNHDMMEELCRQQQQLAAAAAKKQQQMLLEQQENELKRQLRQTANKGYYKQRHKYSVDEETPQMMQFH